MTTFNIILLNIPNHLNTRPIYYFFFFKYSKYTVFYNIKKIFFLKTNS